MPAADLNIPDNILAISLSPMLCISASEALGMVLMMRDILFQVSTLTYAYAETAKFWC